MEILKETAYLFVSRHPFQSKLPHLVLELACVCVEEIGELREADEEFVIVDFNNFLSSREQSEKNILIIRIDIPVAEPLCYFLLNGASVGLEAS